MAVPSRLNEYPVGSTSPTTPRLQPSRSSFISSRGSTGSLEEVPSTTSSSSRK